MLGNDFKFIQISTKTQIKDCIQKLRESDFFFCFINNLKPKPKLKSPSSKRDLFLSHGI